MRIRRVVFLSAVLSSVLGAVAVYFALTVPNDLKADAMLKSARSDISAGHDDHARKTLTTIVQQYPRTDAAAAATVALMRLADEDRARLAAQVANLSKDRDDQRKALQAISGQMSDLSTKAAAPSPSQVSSAPASGTVHHPKAARRPAKKHRTSRRHRSRRRR